VYLYSPNSQGFTWIQWTVEVGVQLCASIDLLGVDGNVNMLLMPCLVERAYLNEWSSKWVRERNCVGEKWMDANIIYRFQVMRDSIGEIEALRYCTKRVNIRINLQLFTTRSHSKREQRKRYRVKKSTYLFR
jgi:hypothetical protein